MADPSDEAVDRAIDHLQSALDALKASQKTDDQESEPKTLSEAGSRMRDRLAQNRAKSAK